MTRFAVAALSLVACGGPQSAPPSAAPAPVASESAPAPAATAAPAEKSAAKSSAKMRAKTSMKLDGAISTAAVVDGVNERSDALGACVPAIRATDTVVGSLNLRVTVSANGQATVAVESAMNDDAKKCVLDAFAGMKVSSGPGRAMVLLEIEE